jgi:hypothetical protein
VVGGGGGELLLDNRKPEVEDAILIKKTILEMDYQESSFNKN